MFGILDLIITLVSIILHIIALPAIFYVVYLLRKIEKNTRNR
jgi:hypothetical protein